MSEFDNDLPVQDELTVLKERATLMGISFHPSIGVDKLRDKINAALNDEPVEEEKPVVKAKAESESDRISRLRREATELVRIRVQCMNPAKSEWEGELFTAGNSAIGSYTKFVPFNAEDGWHVPRIIYKMMMNRKCQVFTTKRDERGNTFREGKLIREFAIEVLPNLTKEELDELARRQALAKSGG